MKNRFLFTQCLICILVIMSCSQANIPVKNDQSENQDITESKPHNYGGWYCPDNLNGFPAIDINNWKSVPVVNGRMPSQEETQNGSSLILVDKEKYPNARPLDITMPKLARFYNRNSGKEELIIVIQALQISTDSIVGFRYLNGGNGSARLDDIDMLSEAEIESLPSSHFVNFSINIVATQAEIWKVLTESEYGKILQPIFDKDNTLGADWYKSSQVNFKYLNRGNVTSEFADNLFGNQYIQIDSKQGENQFVEKFLLLTNEETNETELKVVCGPYASDFENQKLILNNWAQKVKELSEN